MLNIDYKDVNWWYLLICAGGMSAGLGGLESGFVAAITSAAFQSAHTLLAWRREKRAFPLQVRMSYTLLLMLAWIDPLRPLYWMPTIGTWIYLLFGYCTIARSLSLIPAISGEDFSLARVRHILFARPVPDILRSANAAQQA
jgi:hypothetical protein